MDKKKQGITVMVHRIAYWFVHRLQRIDLLVSRQVSSRAVTLAAIGVSAVAGLVLALGGLLHQPALWLAVPPLVLIRLALGALHRSVVRRARLSRPAAYPVLMEETYVDVPAPAAIEDEMLHAVGR